jgi:anti-sigma B factor antagonist
MKLARRDLASADGRSAVALEVVGDVDLEAEEPLVTAVDEVVRGGATAMVDLSGVTFMDSSGVRALFSVRRRHGDAVQLTAVSPVARRVLLVAGVLPLYGLPEDEVTP